MECFAPFVCTISLQSIFEYVDVFFEYDIVSVNWYDLKFLKTLDEQQNA